MSLRSKSQWYSGSIKSQIRLRWLCLRQNWPLTIVTIY